ncbi:MAG TPA: hypothetical protein ENG63_00580 [Candidatus Desulfofervidus auxilii]|uniref:Glycosyltransferase family 1 protein n=1 Tax=Desulfofervidus auxilii TaxID=1621989 RepID=A0A7C0U171_DESA2|nr:hypothetical protein [Candidatus Desulfofervidus auxilii]
MRRKLVIVGSLCWYPDSLKIFLNQGWKVFYIKLSTYRHFECNYKLYRDVGFKELYLPIENLLSKELGKVDKNSFRNIEKILDSDTRAIFIGGGFFNGKHWMYRHLGNSDIVQLIVFGHISRFLKEEGFPAITVRVFNGDVFFGDIHDLKLFTEFTTDIDYFAFENEYQKEYIECITQLKKKFIYLNMELPLKEEIEANYENLFNFLSKEKKEVKRIGVLFMGRYFGEKEKILREIKRSGKYFVPYIFPLRKREIFKKIYFKIRYGFDSFNLASASSVNSLIKSRRQFLRFRLLKNIFLGVGHFYDYWEYLNKGVQYLSFEELKKANIDFFSKISCNGFSPLLYTYLNHANKVISFLSYGIVPIIPCLEINPLYNLLMKNKACIAVESQEDLSYIFRNVNMNDIFKIIENIFNSREEFCFDKNLSVITELLKGVNYHK